MDKIMIEKMEKWVVTNPDKIIKQDLFIKRFNIKEDEVTKYLTQLYENGFLDMIFEICINPTKAFKYNSILDIPKEIEYQNTKYEVNFKDILVLFKTKVLDVPKKVIKLEEEVECIQFTGNNSVKCAMFCDESISMKDAEVTALFKTVKYENKNIVFVLDNGSFCCVGDYIIKSKINGIYIVREDDFSKIFKK